MTGAHRGFGLSSALDFVHVPYPSIGERLDAQNPDMWCRTAVFAVEGPARRVPTQRAVGARAQCAHARRGRCGARLDRVELAGSAAEIRRLLPDLDDAAGDIDAKEMLNRAIATGRTRVNRWRSSAPGHAAAGVHGAQRTDRQVAPQLRQNAVDHHAEARVPAVLGAGRAATAASAIRTSRRRVGRRTTTSTSPPTIAPAFRIRSGTRGRRASCRDHVAVLERTHTGRTRSPARSRIGRPAQVVLRAHPPRHDRIGSRTVRTSTSSST